MNMRLLLLLALLLTGCATTTGPGAGNVDAAALASSNQLQRQALAAYKKRQLMEAFQQVSAAIEKNPANAQAWGLLGLINQRLGRSEAAEKAFNQALRLAPDDPALLNNYGSFLCSQRRWEDAQATFAKAGNATGNAAPEIAWTNAGLCARRAGDNTLAEELLKKAVQHNPGLPTALYQLASLSLENGKPVEASTWLTQYLNHAVHTPKTLLLGARIEHALGNPAGISSYLEKLRSAFPDSSERQQAETLQPGMASPSTTASIYDETWLQQRNPQHFTIQVGAFHDPSQARQVASQLRPPVALYSRGTSHIVLQGDYATLELARLALSGFNTPAAGIQPWIRDFGSIQRRMKR